MDIIYLIGENRELIPMTEETYKSEALLQQLLAEYPQVLAGHTTGDEHRWLLVNREVKLPDEPGGYGRWALDHLFIDESGMPTLVEVKRKSDTPWTTRSGRPNARLRGQPASAPPRIEDA